MLTDETTEGQRALVVTAHPDDVDFGAGGTVATWVDEGVTVTYCICTDGQAGGSDRSVSRADMAALRRKEQVAAAQVLGVDDVRFLGHQDGELYPTHDLRRDISRVIRQVRPHRVLTQSPEIWWERFPASHPDHRAAGEATMNAVYPDARNPFAHPELLEDEGLEPWVVPEVWLMASPRADHHVDITEAIDRKVAALQAHASQTGHMTELASMVREWMQGAARAVGLGEGRYAERFQVVRLD